MSYNLKFVLWDGLGILKNATVVFGLESIIKYEIRKMAVLMAIAYGIGV